MSASKDDQQRRYSSKTHQHITTPSTGHKLPLSSKHKLVTTHNKEVLSKRTQSSKPTVQGSGIRQVHSKYSSVKSCSSLESGSQEMYSSQEGRSGAVSKLEKDILDLQKENAALKQELCTIKSLHEQILHESPCERFEVKRVNVLKTQIFQLERQVLILSQTVDSNSRVLFDVHLMMDTFEENLRTLCKDCSSRVGEDFVMKVKGIKGRLSKCGQKSSMEQLAQPLHFMSGYFKLVDKHVLKSGQASNDFDPDDGVPVTLIDACTGSITAKHLNMEHVGNLESRLAALYRGLTQLQLSLKTFSPSTKLSVFQPIEDHCDSHVTECCKLIGECCHDLLCLSLLVPTAPRRALNGVITVPALTAKNIIKDKLPPSIRSKKEVREAIDSIANTFCYLNEMNQLKYKAMEEELCFHRSVYELQISYMKSLFESVRDGYENFEQSIQEMMCTPLQVMLEKYDELSQSASDDALRQFLLLFKEHHAQFKRVLHDLQRKTTQHPQGVETLSLFGQQFFSQLKTLETNCAKKLKE